LDVRTVSVDMAVTTKTSTGGMHIAYTGTLQEVLDALDSNGYNDLSKVHFLFETTNVYTAIAMKR